MRLFAIVLMLSVPIALIFGGTNVSAAEKLNNKKVILVKRGDTLSKIADKNKTTYKRLFNANKNIKDPDIIYPGQKVRIPAKNEKLKNRFVADASISTTSVNRSYQAQTSPVETGYSSYTAPASYSGGVWDKLAACESGGNWSINTGNGYYGGLQFSQSSWNAVGGSGSPATASKAEQIKRAEMLKSRQGWGAWPACSAKLGLR